MDNIYIVSFTKQGAEISLKLKTLYEFATVFGKYKYENINLLNTDIKSWAAEVFNKADMIIFVSALGIACRAIAPNIVAKDKDPAVIVIDDTAKFVIPLLSGHIGGANERAEEIAKFLHAVPVVTTSTDRNNKFAVDSWAVLNNLAIKDITKIKEVSKRILSGEQVGFYSDYVIKGERPKELVENKNVECGIVISKDINKTIFPCSMLLIPKEYILGVGARKNGDYTHLKSLVFRLLQENNINPLQIKAVTSIDIKKEEKAIIELAKELNIKFITYTKEQLESIKGDFSSSSFVKNITGVDNVCERAVKCYADSEIIVKKTSENGFTLAIGYEKWQGSF